MSGPKKMTVGCVILTVPRRNRVNHAVSVEMASDRTEIVNGMGSVKGPRLSSMESKHLGRLVSSAGLIGRL